MKMATVSSILFVRASMAKSKQHFNLIQLFHETSLIGPLPSGLGRVLNSGPLLVRWFAKWKANFRFYSLENDLTTAFRASKFTEVSLTSSTFHVTLFTLPPIDSYGGFWRPDQDCNLRRNRRWRCSVGRRNSPRATNNQRCIPLWYLPVACRPCELSAVNF